MASLASRHPWAFVAFSQQPPVEFNPTRPSSAKHRLLISRRTRNLSVACTATVALTSVDRALTPFVIESRPWQHREVGEAAAAAIEDAVQEAATTPIQIARAVDTMRKTKNGRRKVYTHAGRDGRRATRAIRKSATPL
jgi:hypothetical protein